MDYKKALQFTHVAAVGRGIRLKLSEQPAEPLPPDMEELVRKLRESEPSPSQPVIDPSDKPDAEQR